MLVIIKAPELGVLINQRGIIAPARQAIPPVRNQLYSCMLLIVENEYGYEA
jgi:hypothetical protein